MKNQVWGAGTWWILEGTTYFMLVGLGLVVFSIRGVRFVVRDSKVRSSKISQNCAKFEFLIKYC